MTHLYPVGTEVIAFGFRRGRVVAHLAPDDAFIPHYDKPFASEVAFYRIDCFTSGYWHDDVANTVMEFQIKPVHPLVLLAECAEDSK